MLDARALVMTLAWLRPCAAIGQAVAIAVAMMWLRLSLQLLPLLAGMSMLLLASPLTFWRLRQSWQVSTAEAVGQVAFDMLLLGWALYFTGGASNPFITLLLLPVALAAATLPIRVMAVVAVLAVAIYGVLIVANVPLADMPMQGSGFRLHLTGMAINFAIAVLLLAAFVGRITASLRRQYETSRRLRERTLRDEGILAIATQAAESAHQLNTPLATLRTLLPELERGREQDAALCEDVRAMIGEVERCRRILDEMVDYGRRQLSGESRATTLGEYMRVNVERFRLLRPEAELDVEIATEVMQRSIRVEPGLSHALLNLMQNACDASRRNGSPLVTLRADVLGDCVEFMIGDHGSGWPHDTLVDPQGRRQPGGLGIGLALARSTIERMRGEVYARRHAEGAQVCVRLPLVRA